MAINNSTYHKSVLTREVLEHLKLEPGKVYVDATFGGGGHTRAILLAQPDCKVIALDWDKVALEKNAPALQEEFGNRFQSVWGNFAHLYKLMTKINVKKVDGILADFGTSQFQIHEKKGFSFSKKSPLDMRMSAAHYYFTAADVVNRYTEKALTKIFFELGEEKYSRAIARAIVAKRKEEPFRYTTQLAKLVDSVIPKRVSSTKRVHPATKVFQALRIYVNKELENIETFLKAAVPFLNPGGRLVCISFHSLEDRLVKTFFRENSDKLSIVTRKPVTAQDDELELNLSARSAKLRAAEKI